MGTKLRWLLRVGSVLVVVALVLVNAYFPEAFPPTPENQRMEGGTEDFNGAVFITAVLMFAVSFIPGENTCGCSCRGGQRKCKCG